MLRAGYAEKAVRIRVELELSREQRKLEQDRATPVAVSLAQLGQVARTLRQPLPADLGLLGSRSAVQAWTQYRERLAVARGNVRELRDVQASLQALVQQARALEQCGLAATGEQALAKLVARRLQLAQEEPLAVEKLQEQLQEEVLASVQAAEQELITLIDVGCVLLGPEAMVDDVGEIVLDEAMRALEQSLHACQTSLAGDASLQQCLEDGPEGEQRRGTLLQHWWCVVLLDHS